MEISEDVGKGLAALAEMLLLSSTATAATTNDLLITSISRDGDYTTLTWNSRPDEFYTVYWTDDLGPNSFWRVAAVNVPNGGTNTVWSEDGETLMSQTLVATAGGETTTLTSEERTTLLAQAKARNQAQLEFLKAQLLEMAARAAAHRAQLKAALDSGMSPAEAQAAVASMETESWPSPPEGGGGGGGTNVVTTAKFYRVARTAVAGIVDGWGATRGSVPTELTDAFAISASPQDSGAHSLAIRADGTVVAWGTNWYGQCDVPTNVTDAVAVAAGGRHSVALGRDGSVVVWGDNTLGQITNAPSNLTNVVDVKAGLWHTLALKADGTVAAWGDLFNRSNAVPSGFSNVIAIAAGPRHCLALKSDHTVVGWGFDLLFRGYYRLTNIPPYVMYLGTNLPAFTNNTVWLEDGMTLPTNVPPGYTAFGSFLPTNVPPDLTNVVAISAGMEHNQALLSDGTVRVWGRTNNPGMRLPNGLTNMLAISAGWHYGVALSPDATLTNWGQDQSVLAFDSVVALSAGAAHGLVIRTNEDFPVIRSHPRNAAAPVGEATNVWVYATSAQTLSYQWQRWDTDGLTWTNLPNHTATNLYFASLHDSDDGGYRVVVSTDAGSVASRSNWVETIHIPVITNQTPDLILRLPQRTSTNLAVYVYSKGSRNVTYDWFKDGTNVADKLFTPGTFFSSYPIYFANQSVEGQYWVIACNEAGCATSDVWQVSTTLTGETSVWGDGEAGQTNTLRAETNLVAISAGGFHTLALREDGTVLAWGWNSYGETNVPAGLTNITGIAAGLYHSLAVAEDRHVTGWGDDSAGQSTIPASLSNVVSVSAGGYHSLALRKDGQVVGWGDTNSGAADVPTDCTNVMAIAAGYWHSLALHSNGTVTCWGDNQSGQCDAPAGLTNVVAIAAGGYHSLALTSDGHVTGWGYNAYGETNSPADLTNAMRISAGYLYSLALRNDGSVAAWGWNEYGQTNVPHGLGDTYAISAGYYHATALAYNPLLNYPVDPSQDLLLIANTNSADSTNLLNYYLAHRPMVGNANVLRIGGFAGEAYTNSFDFTNDFLPPLLGWYQDHPTERPAYHICFIDVPTRLPGFSVAGAVRRVFQHRPPTISHINMGQKYIDIAGATNNMEDALHYIDKLAAFGSTYCPGKLAISASAGGYANDTYLLDDEARFYPDASYPPPYDQYPPKVGAGGFIGDGIPAMLQSGVLSNRIDYIPQVASSNVFTRVGTNIAGYMSWGH